MRKLFVWSYALIEYIFLFLKCFIDIFYSQEETSYCLITELINAIIMVTQDHIVKTHSIAEYLRMIGIFGLSLSSAQV